MTSTTTQTSAQKADAQGKKDLDYANWLLGKGRIPDAEKYASMAWREYKVAGDRTGIGLADQLAQKINAASANTGFNPVVGSAIQNFVGKEYVSLQGALNGSAADNPTSLLSLELAAGDFSTAVALVAGTIQTLVDAAKEIAQKVGQ